MMYEHSVWAKLAPAETQSGHLSGLVTLISNSRGGQDTVHLPVILLTASSQLETQRGLDTVSWSTLWLVSSEKQACCVREVVLNVSLLARWALLIPTAVWGALEEEKLLRGTSATETNISMISTHCLFLQISRARLSTNTVK